MQAALHIQGHGAGCCARLGRHASMPSFGPILTPARGCQLSCSASVQVQYLSTRGLRASQRRGRREAAVCKAAAKNFYEILGVSQSASDRDIKSTYRKLAMKLHPDVNKRPDAQQRFMEVKVAYETLSDSKQRAEYDRRLRMGGLGGYGARGAAGRSSNAGSYGAYGTGPNYTQEPVPGLDDLIRELEKEFTAWFKSREKGSKEKTLLEELEDLGGELLDFLEESLGIKDEPPPSRSSASAASQGSSRDTRSAAERFDDILRQYGEYAAPGAGAATSNSSTGGGSGDTGYRPDMSGGSSASTNSTTTPRAPTPGRVDDNDIEAQLQALKKKLKKV